MKLLNVSITLLVLLGVVFCYLAFGFVHWLAFALLFHWGGIACLLAAGVAIWVWLIKTGPPRS